MINAVMHILAWGLVLILVWGHFDAPVVQQKSYFKNLAELGDGTYLVASGEANAFGLIKYEAAQLGYRAIKVDDWEGALTGQIIGLCAVKGYDGEVIAARVSPEGSASLVHLQFRNWSKTPKSIILGQVAVPAIKSIKALSCGGASKSSMAVTLYGESQKFIAELDFHSYQLLSSSQVSSSEVVPVAYENSLGRWVVVPSPERFGSDIWFSPRNAEAYLAFRLDGFNVTGLAAGPEGYDLSVVTADSGLGSVWRPLRLASPAAPQDRIQ